MNAHDWVKKLNLEPHSEGGYFKKTYHSDINISLKTTTRAVATSILFLLKTNNPSHFHRLKSDETWYYHAGHPLTVHMIFPNGEYKTVSLGLGEHDILQFTVPRGVIFGSTVESNNDDDFAIVGCCVTPAFDYDDFELFTQKQLLAIYPQHKDIIHQLAYDVLP
ncbi:cupin [Granulicatella sp. zg-ZJ]|uniref:cupin domain-containing protein n=1 Tax=Granulicatella sp. zg-ZJ TaxID=2678504 RepID=UPI0013D4994F|nr:cupin domain-containing protein [Granulicatella sp. zg-ZJ]NEW63069.1 cupin [Granulicatella sp. zg-ZJ]